MRKSNRKLREVKKEVKEVETIEELAKRGALVESTAGYSGAEIEQAIVSAIYSSREQ